MKEIKSSNDKKYLWNMVLLCLMLLTHYNVLAQSALSVIPPSDAIQNLFLKYDVSETMSATELVQNGVKLDSIVEFENSGLIGKGFKTYFTYENENLVTKTRIHFKSSFTDSLYVTEVWQFNKQQQLLNYKKLKRLEEWHDTIVADKEMNYVYYGDTLVERNVSMLRAFFFSESRYNGVPYNAGEALYDTYNESYTYNNLGQLIQYKGGFYRKDIKYQYDEQGRLVYEFNVPNLVLKYDYGITNTVKNITIYRHVFSSDVIDFDSINNWTQSKVYSYSLDQYGRDSICNANQYNYYFTKSSFGYDSNNHFIHQSIYFLDDMDSTLWLELGRIDYKYTEESRLELFHQTYYNNTWNNWDTQIKREYYYSPLKGAEAESEKPEGTIRSYPNPASDHITIQIENSTQAQYQIYDLYGRQIMKGNLTNNTVDVSGLERGTYLLKIINDNSINVKRFIKQ